MTTNFSSGEKLKLKLSSPWDNLEKYGKLIEVSGYESSGELFNYLLLINTTDKDIAKEVFCGKTLSFTIETYKDNKLDKTRLFNGIIKQVSFVKRKKAETSNTPEFEYVLEVVPKLHLLTNSQHSRVFYKEGQTIIDVIEEVLKEHKIDYELSIKDPSIFPAETCIQYNECDYDFLRRLIQNAGLFYFFKHEKTKHTIFIGNQVTPYFDLDPSEIEYREPQDNSNLGITNVSSVYTSHSTEFMVKAFSYPKPEDLVENTYKNDIHTLQEKPIVKNDISTYLSEIKDATHIDKFAESFGAAKQSFSERISGSSNCPTFTVGGKFKLKGDFFANIDKKEQVIIQLTFKALEYLSDQEQYSSTFIAIPKDRFFIWPEAITKPIISGLHFAIIVDKEGKSSGEEPLCDEQGNLYIKLLWDKKNPICRARLLSSINTFVLPRIGSLVYVCFPGNNLYNDIPVIIGLHNPDSMNFTEKDEWHKSIYTAYPAASDKSIYNSITFIDQKDKQELKVKATKDVLVEIKNLRQVTIDEGTDSLILNKGDIIIETKEGGYTLTCKGPITIKSDDEIIMEATANFSIKAGGDVNIEAGGAVAVSAGGAVAVSGGADVVVDAGLSSTIIGATELILEGTATTLKGKANTVLSSPMTKIGM